MTPTTTLPPNAPGCPTNSLADSTAPRPLGRAAAVLQRCLGVLQRSFFNAANESGPDDVKDGEIGIANAFIILQDDWLEIPFGDQVYDDGINQCIQRLDRAAAEEMVRKFYTFRGQATRTWGGLPFYVGHPDHPLFADEDSDKKAYGWIMNLQVRQEALAMQVKWSDAGKELIAQAHYKYFSQHWRVEKSTDASGNIIGTPIWLISAGLTNNPNWHVTPLANEATKVNHKQKEHVMLEKLRVLLGMANTATEAEVETAIAGIQATAATVPTLQQAMANEKTAREAAEAGASAGKTAADATLLAANTARTEAETALKAEKTAHIETMVNSAITRGAIVEADKDQWLKDLADDFANKSIELKKATDAIKTTQTTVNDASRKSQAHNTQGKILDAVNSRMEKSKLSYHDAYMAVQTEQPELFKEEAVKDGE